MRCVFEIPFGGSAGTFFEFVYTRTMSPEELFRQKFALIYRFFYYKDVNKEDIEDLSQEVFVRFFAKYDSFRLSEERCVKTLYRIARYIWLEWLRALDQSTVSFNEEMDFVESYEEFQDESSEDNEQRTQLLEYIKGLNPTLKKVITLRFIHGKTRKEIAEEMSIKEKYVHIYQQRGIRLLQKMASKTVSPHT